METEQRASPTVYWSYLVSTLMTAVPQLDIHCDICDMKELCHAVSLNRSLTSIHLSNKRKMIHQIDSFIESLKKNSTVKKIELPNTLLGDDGAKTISEFLKLKPNLTEINISSNLLTSVGINALAEALKCNHTLCVLNMSNQGKFASVDGNRNKFDRNGFRTLFAALKENTGIQSLNLKFVDLMDTDMSSLSETIKVNQSISIIDLQGNLIGDLGVELLVSGLYQNNSITTLNLGDNHITNQGTKILSAYLEHNKSLRTLDIGNNILTIPAIHFLFQSLRFNVTLNQIKILSDSHLKAEEHILNCLETNRALTDIEIITESELVWEKLKENKYKQNVGIKRFLTIFIILAKDQNNRESNSLWSTLPRELKTHIHSLVSQQDHSHIGKNCNQILNCIQFLTKSVPMWSEQVNSGKRSRIVESWKRNSIERFRWEYFE
jgi:hypothetical protein